MQLPNALQCKQWRNFLSFLHLFAILSILSMRPSHWFYKPNYNQLSILDLLLETRSLGPERGTVVDWHFSHKKITDFVPISTKRYNILIRYAQRLHPPHSQLPWFKRCCCFSPICVHSMHTYLSLWLKKDFFSFTTLFSQSRRVLWTIKPCYCSKTPQKLIFMPESAKNKLGFVDKEKIF